MLVLRNNDFFLENDTVLEWHVLVSVLERLATLDLNQIEAVLVGGEVDDQLALVGVVRHDALDDHHIALIIRVELETVKLAVVLRGSALKLEQTLGLVDEFQSHELHKVWVAGTLYSQVDTGQLVGHFELVFGEDVVLTGFERQEVGRVGFGSELAL